MARPIKDGVSYFPKDGAFYDDDKVKLLRAEYGAKGMYLLDYLLCECYGKNGYYITWDKVKRTLIADSVRCGISPAFVEEFVTGCIRCSFFDERVAMSFGVLTSAGIQRRYVRMFNSRSQIKMRREYFLLDLQDREDLPESILSKLVLIDKSTENPDKITENADKSTENTQSKEKEKKKAEATLKAEESTASSSPSLDEVIAYAAERGNRVNPHRFFRYYERRKWRDATGTAFDWRERMRDWETNGIPNTLEAQKERYGTFDAEDAFKAALRRTYGEEKDHG